MMPVRALSLGYDIDRFRLLAFVLSAALSGLAGATKAIAFQFASLTDVHWATSGDVILMVLLGGVGTTFGPVVGAIVIVSLDEFLADSGLPIQPIIGTIFVLCILAVSQRNCRDHRTVVKSRPTQAGKGNQVGPP